MRLKPFEVCPNLDCPERDGRTDGLCWGAREGRDMGFVCDLREAHEGGESEKV